MSASMSAIDPVLREVRLHVAPPHETVTAVITKNELCVRGPKSAKYVRHIEFDVSGTALEGAFAAGQSFGVVPPGVDEMGRPHQVRLYSLASPSAGEDGAGKILSTTVKRTFFEHPETGELVLGIASNYLCNLQVGDAMQVTGPNGKRFVLPVDIQAHDYLFIATGTGVAPFRGMLLELLARGCERQITLIMGSPYTTDLLYHEEFEALSKQHANFRYLTAISREDNGPALGKLYVQDRLRASMEVLRGQLASTSNLIYICGIAGMELGIFQALASELRGPALAGYLAIDPAVAGDVGAWSQRMIHRKVKPTRRVMLEVYA